MLKHFPKKIYDRSGKLIYVSEKDDYDDAKLTNADLANQNLEGAIMMCADLRSADLHGAELYWAILFDSDLESADLRGASLRGADLKEVNFKYAKLQGADMGRDNLGGITEIKGAIIDCAEYDGHTIFPEGFDPEASGMIRT